MRGALIKHFKFLEIIKTGGTHDSAGVQFMRTWAAHCRRIERILLGVQEGAVHILCRSSGKKQYSALQCAREPRRGGAHFAAVQEGAVHATLCRSS